MSVLTPPKINLVALSAGLSHPSKTQHLVQHIVDAFEQKIDVDTYWIKFNELAPLFSGAIYRNQLPQAIIDALEAIESADFIIVGTPVFRASYSGLFKHFFDFVDQFSLVDTPVLLAASGGSERHALILEHQLRPLFSFFQAQTLAIGIYATEQDFNADYQINNQKLQERIALAVHRALPIIEKKYLAVDVPNNHTLNLCTKGKSHRQATV